MPRGNPSPKISITLDSEVHQKISSAAARKGMSLSAWINRMALEALHRQAGLDAIAEWEEEHGAFTHHEKNEARRRVLAQLQTAKKARRSA